MHIPLLSISDNGDKFNIESYGKGFLLSTVKKNKGIFSKTFVKVEANELIFIRYRIIFIEFCNINY